METPSGRLLFSITAITTLRLVEQGSLTLDDPGAAALARRTEELGIRVLRYGSDPTLPLQGTLFRDWVRPTLEAAP